MRLSNLAVIVCSLVTLVAQAVPDTSIRMEYITPSEQVSTSRARAVPCYNKTQKGMAQSLREKDFTNEPCVPSPMKARRGDRPEFEVNSPGMPFQEGTF
ncbi:hypothetical protein D3C87_88000 [compost metagenome]